MQMKQKQSSWSPLAWEANSMVSTTVEIDANGMIELPEEMLKELGWGVDDEIEWVDQGDGSFLLHKVND